jgi:hypothetical protein
LSKYKIRGDGSRSNHTLVLSMIEIGSKRKGGVIWKMSMKWLDKDNEDIKRI